MTSALFVAAITLSAIACMLLGYFIPRAKVLMFSIGFYFVMTALFAGYSNWLPQVRGEVPQETKVDPSNIESMPKDKLVELGETIIFGGVGGMDARRTDGKGQCPLCHTFKKGDIGDRAPNLLGIGTRGAQRIKDPKYLKPNTVQTEAFSGSGRAATAEEYIELLIHTLIPKTASHFPSMLQDARRGKRTEIDSLNGMIVRLGAEAGIPVSANEEVICTL